MKLTQIKLKGYKSISHTTAQTIPFGDVTVLLGANGSGKSNLVSFFKMLNFLMTDGLQEYVGKYGCSRLLFYGPKKSQSISFEVQFKSDMAHGTYEVKLSHGLPDRLFVSKEKVNYFEDGDSAPQSYDLTTVTSESGLKSNGRQIDKVLFGLLSGIRTYQFHDTSETSKIKDRGYIDDASYLHGDGGNLAPFLKMLKEHDPFYKYYQRIVRHIRHVMPQFGDFVLTTIPGNENYVRLNWKENTGHDYLFDPDQISDGALRFMALSTLLLQPPELLPKFIVLDEPELGLHPAAIGEIAGIIRAAAKKCQILLATQSTRLVDEFSADELLIVERNEEKQCSEFKKLNSESLTEWLEHYTLSDLWEKNVLGGQP